MWRVLQIQQDYKDKCGCSFWNPEFSYSSHSSHKSLKIYYHPSTPLRIPERSSVIHYDRVKNHSDFSSIKVSISHKISLQPRWCQLLARPPILFSTSKLWDWDVITTKEIGCILITSTSKTLLRDTQKFTYLAFLSNATKSLKMKNIFLLNYI